MATAREPEPLDTIAITECKAHFLRLADEVARSGRAIVVTRHGRPLIRLEAATAPERPSLRGTMTQLVTDEELLRPVLGAWESDPWPHADG